MIVSALFAISLAHGGQIATQDFLGKKGRSLPPFSITTVDGKKITRESLKGKIVVLDFWATWCGPCKQASPVMQKLYTDLGKKGVVVIGADTFERTEGPASARKYKAEHKFSYPFTYNDDNFAHSLGIPTLPAFAIVDRKGVIRDALLGIPLGGPQGMYAYFSRKIAALK